MKRAGIIFCITAAMIVTLCGCGGSSGRGVGQPDVSSKEAAYKTGDASISDKIENIVIDWSSGEILFAAHETDTVDISEEISENTKDDMRMHWRLDGTTLYIRDRKPAVQLISFGSLKKNLSVTLPADLSLESLKIDAASANISGSDLSAKALNIDITSGKLDIGCTAEAVDIDATSADINAQCSARAIRIDSTSGRIDLTQKGSADSIAMNVTSGDIRLTADGFKKLDIDGTSSDVTLSLPADMGFTANADLTSGNFSSALPVQMEKGSYIAGDGSAQIRIDLTSGDLSILEK